MTIKKTALHMVYEKAVDLGPPPPGNLAIPVFNHGSMEIELYNPEETDPQTPHSRDEIYFVINGSGEFFNGQENVKVEKGSLLFVPAGIEHRFLNFSQDFAVWVIFYGPEGGEGNE